MLACIGYCFHDVSTVHTALHGLQHVFRRSICGSERGAVVATTYSSANHAAGESRQHIVNNIVVHSAWARHASLRLYTCRALISCLHALVAYLYNLGHSHSKHTFMQTMIVDTVSCAAVPLTAIGTVCLGQSPANKVVRVVLHMLC